jgi:hypothetical protein
MPQISGPNLQENHIIETCKEEGCAVSTQETAAWREWENRYMWNMLIKYSSVLFQYFLGCFLPSNAPLKSTDGFDRE